MTDANRRSAVQATRRIRRLDNPADAVDLDDLGGDLAEFGFEYEDDDFEPDERSAS